MSIESRKRLENLAEGLRVFVGTPVHETFVSGTREQLGVVEEFILNDPIDDLGALVRLIEFKGQRAVLRANLTLFEDALSNLGDRIEQMLDEENQTRAKTETT